MNIIIVYPDVPMFSTLPIDILHYGILPYLDYNSIINYNKILGVEQHIQRLNPSFLLKIETSLSLHKIRKITYSPLHTLDDISSTLKGISLNALKFLKYDKSASWRLVRVVRAIIKRLSVDTLSMEMEDYASYRHSKRLMMDAKQILHRVLISSYTEPPWNSDIRPSTTMAPLHIVDGTAYLPYFDRMDEEMEKELEEGRRMMNFWRLRGDFD